MYMREQGAYTSESDPDSQANTHHTQTHTHTQGPTPNLQEAAAIAMPAACRRRQVY